MVFQELLRNIMNGQGFADRLYDHVRLVDPVSKRVLAHIDNRTKETCDITKKCYTFFNRRRACENCISMMAVGKREQMVKLDYADPNIYFALAEPVEFKGKWYVVEVLKDITASGMMRMEGEEAIAMTRLLDHRNNMVFRDTLTRIYRDNFIETRLPHDLYRVHSEGETMALLLIVIRNLKEINDTCGIQVGDRVLKECAAVLKAIYKMPEAWTARYTGSEFVAVKFKPDAARAQYACKRIHDRLSRIKLPKGCAAKPAYSIGFWITDGKDMTPEKLISAARGNVFVPTVDKAILEKAALLQKAFPEGKFTLREKEVAVMLLDGKSNLDIADALFIGLSTVKKHVAGLFGKAQVKSRSEFISKTMK